MMFNSQESGPDVVLSAEASRRFASDLFCAAEVPAGAAPPSATEAAIVADSLVESNLRGHDSHGLLRVLEYLEQLSTGELVAGAPLTTLSESTGHLAADAGRGFGQVQCAALIDRLWDKAKAAGIACGALRQCGHVGRLGEWSERIAARGGCGLVAVTDNGVPRVVAPPGGLEARLSTNPLALGVPTEGEPLVLDFSTSAVANGKLKAARLANRPVPYGWIQDAAGEPSTDPFVMLADPPGTLLPFGGDQAYKAFGLSVLLDVLVSGLAGGFCPPAPDGTVEFNNVLMVVWSPARFAGESQLRGQADHLIAALRATPTKPGVSAIQLPGDRALAVKARRLVEGIPVSGRLWRELLTVARQRGVEVPPVQPCE
jgi:hydroxycarboxylate dehydrogenase B